MNKMNYEITWWEDRCSRSIKINDVYLAYHTAISHKGVYANINIFQDDDYIGCFRKCDCGWEWLESGVPYRFARVYTDATMKNKLLRMDK